MLAKIKLQPGINRDDTNYSNSGGWFDSNFIRFRNGLPEKIGGWTKIYANLTPEIVQGWVMAALGEEQMAAMTEGLTQQLATLTRPTITTLPPPWAKLPEHTDMAEV